MQAKVECPRCGRVHTVPLTASLVECDCHLYCSHGSKSSDCDTSLVTFNGQLNWPAGSHQNSANEGDDILHRIRYCSTHDKYIYKTPVAIEVKWSDWQKKERIPEKYRLLKKR